MEYFSAIGSIAFIWFLVVTIPGPNFVVVTQVSMAKSRKMGFFIALGVSIGAGIWASASLLGLNVLFKYAGWLYDAIKVMGGCYLIYMGIKIIWYAIRQPVSLTDINKSTDNNGATFQKGLFTSFSNPKTAAFFGSLFLSSFPAQAPFWLNVVTVLIVIAISILWYCLVAYFFSLNKIQIIYKSAKRILDMMTGSLLFYLGGKLILGRT
jgi:RhtB (resistance to homoserine/threonine) family protein